MALEKEQCDGCGTTRTVCPECGSTHVTPYEPADPRMPLTMSVMGFIRQADPGDSATFEHVCWSCGWDEQWTISVDQ